MTADPNYEMPRSFRGKLPESKPFDLTPEEQVKMQEAAQKMFNNYQAGKSPFA